MMEILKGVYIYIYEQYGLHYGRDFIPNDPPVLETTEEKRDTYYQNCLISTNYTN